MGNLDRKQSEVSSVGSSKTSRLGMAAGAFVVGLVGAHARVAEAFDPAQDLDSAVPGTAYNSLGGVDGVSFAGIPGADSYVTIAGSSSNIVYHTTDGVTFTDVTADVRALDSSLASTDFAVNSYAPTQDSSYLHSWNGDFRIDNFSAGISGWILTPVDSAYSDYGSVDDSTGDVISGSYSSRNSGGIFDVTAGTTLLDSTAAEWSGVSDSSHNRLGYMSTTDGFVIYNTDTASTEAVLDSSGWATEYLPPEFSPTGQGMWIGGNAGQLEFFNDGEVASSGGGTDTGTDTGSGDTGVVDTGGEDTGGTDTDTGGADSGDTGGSDTSDTGETGADTDTGETGSASTTLPSGVVITMESGSTESTDITTNEDGDVVITVSDGEGGEISNDSEETIVLDASGSTGTEVAVDPGSTVDFGAGYYPAFISERMAVAPTPPPSEGQEGCSNECASDGDYQPANVVCDLMETQQSADATYDHEFVFQVVRGQAGALGHKDWVGKNFTSADGVSMASDFNLCVTASTGDSGETGTIDSGLDDSGDPVDDSDNGNTHENPDPTGCNACNYGGALPAYDVSALVALGLLAVRRRQK